MKVDFRQGIIRYQTDISGNANHIVKGSPDPSFVDLVSVPEPTIVTIAHGDDDYTIEENTTIRKAWGPFPPTGDTQYLYWEIDLVSGEVSRGFTLFAPIVSPSEPLVRREDQHWFDRTENVMKVYNPLLSRYMPVLRVFAAIYNQNATIVAFPVGSQVGLSNKTVRSGFVLFDSDGVPIRTRHGKFVTSEHAIITNGESSKSNSATTGFKIEGRIQIVVSGEIIPKLSCVTLVSPRAIELASYSRTDRIVSGIIGDDMLIGEKGRLITGGQIHDPNWNFPIESVNRYLFCGMDGEVTLTPPPSGVSQIIGILLDTDTILFQPQMPIILH